jgi:hypothetical protein
MPSTLSRTISCPGVRYFEPASSKPLLSPPSIWAVIRPERLEAIVGLLRLLSKQAKEPKRRELLKLERGVLSDGRPRDLAEERWVKEKPIFLRTPLKAGAVSGACFVRAAPRGSHLGQGRPSWQPPTL